MQDSLPAGWLAFAGREFKPLDQIERFQFLHLIPLSMAYPDASWAHMRRKVIEAEKVAPEIAREAIELVRTLYVVEKRARDLSAMARLELRQEESAPVLSQLRKKLLEWKEQLLPKHPMAEAVNYALGQWTELNVFCSDGAVAIDNNVSEREMKRVVLNRNNSLFVGNPRGGRTAARYRPTAVSHAVADESIAGAKKRTAQLAARPVETTAGGTAALVAPVLHSTAHSHPACRPNGRARVLVALTKIAQDRHLKAHFSRHIKMGTIWPVNRANHSPSGISTLQPCSLTDSFL